MSRSLSRSITELRAVYKYKPKCIKIKIKKLITEKEHFKLIKLSETVKSVKQKSRDKSL